VTTIIFLLCKYSSQKLLQFSVNLRVWQANLRIVNQNGDFTKTTSSSTPNVCRCPQGYAGYASPSRFVLSQRVSFTIWNPIKKKSSRLILNLDTGSKSNPKSQYFKWIFNKTENHFRSHQFVHKAQNRNVLLTAGETSNKLPDFDRKKNAMLHAGLQPRRKKCLQFFRPKLRSVIKFVTFL
jgi:hypothetical protein